jgi:hypothetical protein
MDIVRPEQVDVPYDPLDVVEHVLVAENLPFDRTDEGDLAFALAGDWKDYELWFAWRPEGDTLQLCLSMDLTVPEAQRATAQELIGQTVNVDQVAQAHPLILGRVGAGMLKGMGAAECDHQLTIQIELLAALPSQRKAG